MKRIAILLLVCMSNGWLFANHWTPNDSSYEDNMTLTGVIQIDGVEQQSTTLEVGVFCGAECRGSGYAACFAPTQHYLVQLLIFGEVGNRFTFKLYDHALGQELNLTSPGSVTFRTNGYGSLSNPYVLNFTGSIPESYVVSANAHPVEGGTIEGAGTYLGGQTCTLTATANEGYAFTNWIENGTIVSTNPTYAFSVTSNRTLIANFTNTGSNHWIPNQSSYEDNMTLTGVIQINGVEQQSTTLEVGVFCGEECRGSGLATYFLPTQRYVVQLLIFGEAGDQLTFKLYDHAIGRELNLTSPNAVTFVANGYGSLGNPYVLNFTGTLEITQTVNLLQGWNWFSTNVEITLNDLKAALVEASPGTPIIIKSKENGTTSYNGNIWEGQLNTLDVAQMYRISVPNDCEITIEGIPIHPFEHPISIQNGFNWIGFPLSESMSVIEAFSGFAIEGDIIKSRNSYSVFNGTSWRGDLNTLEPGKGYMYKSNAQGEKTFTF